MKVESTTNEYVISLPKGVFGSDYIDKLLADLRLIEISSKTKGSENDVEKISAEINTLWWEKNRASFFK